MSLLLTYLKFDKMQTPHPCCHCQRKLCFSRKFSLFCWKFSTHQDTNNKQPENTHTDTVYLSRTREKKKGNVVYLELWKLPDQSWWVSVLIHNAILSVYVQRAGGPETDLYLMWKVVSESIMLSNKWKLTPIPCAATKAEQTVGSFAPQKCNWYKYKVISLYIWPQNS